MTLWFWLNRLRNCRTLKVSDYVRRAGQESVWLIAHALGIEQSAVYARAEFLPEESAKIQQVFSRREAGEPLQYILGEADFYGRDFRAGPGVLIPRHDTETLIQAVKRHFSQNEAFTFTDWGTGSGCIAITILLEFPKTHAYLVEASSDARKYAVMNLERYNLTHRAEFVDALPECTLTVSNPPYIPSGEIAGLMNTVRDYEPHMALDGGTGGMDFYRQIFAQAESTCIILETGNMNQVHALKTMSSKYICCDEVSDDGIFPRCLVFRRRNIHEETNC